MMFRKRPHAVGRQELSLVQSTAQQALQAMAAQQRQQELLPTRNQPRQIRTMLDEPMRTTGELWKSHLEAIIEHFHCKHWKEAHDRPRLQGQQIPIRQVQHVVVKLVSLVPEACSLAANILHGIGDEQEMLEELKCYVL